MLDELDDQDTAASRSSRKLYFTHYCTSFDR